MWGARLQDDLLPLGPRSVVPPVVGHFGSVHWTDPGMEVIHESAGQRESQNGRADGQMLFHPSGVVGDNADFLPVRTGYDDGREGQVEIPSLDGKDVGHHSLG